MNNGQFDKVWHLWWWYDTVILLLVIVLWQGKLLTNRDCNCFMWACLMHKMIKWRKSLNLQLSNNCDGFLLSTSNQHNNLELPFTGKANQSLLACVSGGYDGIDFANFLMKVYKRIKKFRIKTLYIQQIDLW